jgi:phage terminase Nu1 subunit (DNA packaging protein)
VQQLAAEDVIPRTKDGFRLGEGVQAYTNWLKEAQKRTSPSVARDRVLAARAEQLEMANRERAHKLLDTEEAIAFLDEIIGTFRTELGGLPARLTRDLARRGEIEREVDRLCGRISDLFAKRETELRSTGAVSVPSQDEVEDE